MPTDVVSAENPTPPLGTARADAPDEPLLRLPVPVGTLDEPRLGAPFRADAPPDEFDEPPLHLRSPTATAALARHRARQRGGAPTTSSGPGFLAEYLAAPWVRVVVVAVAATVVLTGALVFSLVRGDGGRSAGEDETAGRANPATASPSGVGSQSATAGTETASGATGSAATPSDSSTPSAPSTTTAADGTVTTTPSPSTTAPRSPSTTAPGADGPAGDPLASCSPGQRAAIERGNHPSSWYVDRYDPDGNGIFCE